MKKVLLILAAVLCAGCDPRAVSAKMTNPTRHEFPQDSTVCYTYSTTISCVKVK